MTEKSFKITCPKCNHEFSSDLFEDHVEQHREGLRAEERAKAQQEADRKVAEVEKKSEIHNKRMLAKAQDISRPLQQKSQEIQGEVQEQQLEDFLKDKFPNDQVQEIKKGAKGADCVLMINSPEEGVIAKICFESKNTKEYKKEWEGKLLEDMKRENIDYGVLVTRALPKDFDKDSGQQERPGNIVIAPLDYRILHTIVEGMRKVCLQSWKAKQQGKSVDISKDMQNLWGHMTSPAFGTSIRLIMNYMETLKELTTKEKEWLEKNLIKREKKLEDMKEGMRDMLLALMKIGGTKMDYLESSEEEE